MRLPSFKNVKLLSIDAMNTLIKLKDPPGVTYTKFASEYGIKADPDLLQSRFLASFKGMEKSHPYYGIHDIGPTNWWSHVIQNCFGKDYNFPNQDIKDELCLRLYEYYATKEPWILLEHDILQKLDKLRSNGLSVSITSNFDSRLRSVLLEFGILNHVDFIALSGEIGAAKPEPKVFETLMEYFGLSSPIEILHIGDSVEKDLRGALNCGVQACLYSHIESDKIPDDLKEKVYIIKDLNDFILE